MVQPQPKIFQPHPLLRRLVGPLADRPRLLSAIAVGAVVTAGLWLVPNPLSWSTRSIFAWNATALWFIAASFLMMLDCDGSKIQARAAAQDEGGHLVLALAVFAAIASIVAIAAELAIAKNDHGLVKGMRVGLVFLTIAASWLFVQIIFALHYAHEFYATDDGKTVRGGLGFPGEDRADYWDFLHFALIIGVANQTADVQFTSRRLRHIGTIHGVVAFLFNTVVLALSINLGASLF